MAEDLVLLHGFGGGARSWERVVARLGGERYRPLAIDIPGESLDSAVAGVLAAAPGAFTLCGYSMGGRIALHVALAAPERVARLILVATTAGIEDATERRQRREADAALADSIENWTIEQFADHWQRQPLFAGTKSDVAEFWRADLLERDPKALAATLRALGPGTPSPVWDRLGELAMPVTVIAGERDHKYLAIARRLAAAIPAADLRVVGDAGHGLPREAPAALATLIEGAA
ncbi:MAG TPA: alpha/beta fold hydrolase [Baekduia sp.]|nr:alpha/beta fold hydrolase [Baekduia sp.]